MVVYSSLFTSCPGERLCCCWMVVVYESNAKIFISTRALHSTTCSPTATWSSIHEKHHCLLARTFEPVYHPLDIGVRSIGDLSRSGQLHWRQQAQAYYLIEDARLQITSSSQIQRYQLSLWDAVYERSLKADLCGAYGSVSWRPSVIQQIHEIVEVAAEALLRYDTGVLAENQGALFGAFSWRRSVAEVHEAFDHTTFVKLILRHESRKLRQSCRSTSELLLNPSRNE